ncbi:MAG TPA: undecaprenyl-diphosphate phosphatase, partial [Bdellovibrionales bacterium]|nr:undecaprenyl-diphosphate phosphatase [Bdellovibrionales bacterium]
MLNWWQALILAVVEGLTEYLPVSSTGHLIIASALMGLNEESFVKSFNIIVQFGAILSVMVLYWRRLLAPPSFYLKIAAGFLPAAVIGMLVKDEIDAILGSVEVVGAALFVGGLALIFIDRKPGRFDGGKTIAELSYKEALLIGLCQCFAFIPGVSRSAASIVGGLAAGLSRREAAEFSFFLAVPTLSGATAIKVLKIAPTITQDQIGIILLGNLVSFIVGCLAIKGFIDFLAKRGFFAFGLYRVAVGVVIFILMAAGLRLS